MEINNFSPDYSIAEQLEKYAEDLAKARKTAKQKQKDLDAANRQLTKYAEDLNKNVSKLKAAYRELQDAYLDTIHRLVIAAEYKDEDTGSHIARMSRFSALLAEKLGLPPDEVQNIRFAAPMHDVGKIGIPDHILLKSGKLTVQEFELMKNHTIIGAKILSNSKAKILPVAERIALSHHEKWNGKGYPQGLSRDNIPLVGRIVALADTFDALISQRPYKEPYPLAIAFEIIKKERGQHFDPDLADVFLENIDEILKIKSETASTGDSSLFDFTLSKRDQDEENFRNLARYAR
jgi:putative two-component system response regulator